MMIINNNCNNQLVQRMPQKQRRLHLQATIGQDNNNLKTHNKSIIQLILNVVTFYIFCISHQANFAIFKSSKSITNQSKKLIQSLFSKYFYSNSPNIKTHTNIQTSSYSPKKSITQATTSIYLYIFNKVAAAMNYSNQMMARTKSFIY
ncbi:hypothetical protein ABPG74_007761 [Tetrahymena malaccensis]